jgi:hypothetical protein
MRIPPACYRGKTPRKTAQRSLMVECLLYEEWLYMSSEAMRPDGHV